MCGNSYTIHTICGVNNYFRPPRGGSGNNYFWPPRAGDSYSVDIDAAQTLGCFYESESDFVGKSIGGLKTHTRRMHSTATNCYLCEFCTFTAKTENEVKEHTTKWNITNSKIDFNLHYKEVNCEMFALKQIGLVLLGFTMWDNERWSLWMERNFYTPGKNPR